MYDSNDILKCPFCVPQTMNQTFHTTPYYNQQQPPHMGMRQEFPDLNWDASRPNLDHQDKVKC